MPAGLGLRLRVCPLERHSLLTLRSKTSSLAGILHNAFSILIKIANPSLLILALALATSSCGEKPSPSAATSKTNQSFAVKGIIRELKTDGRTVVIRHEKIPDYMEAMTMPFRVRDTNELAGLNPGDEVNFRLIVTEEASWMEHVTRTGRSIPIEPKPAPSSTATATNEPGVFRLGNIPDFALTNEFRQPLSLQFFTGRAVAMTFFFTRCPIPEYCPRLTKNFQGAIEKLKAIPDGPTNFHFLSVSFDPVDSPLVLRSYGSHYRYDSNHWSFVTGNIEQIQELARGFGVSVKLEGGTYDHNFSTAIFDATGKLQNLWPIGGDMTDQIVTDMTKAALAK